MRFGRRADAKGVLVVNRLTWVAIFSGWAVLIPATRLDTRPVVKGRVCGLRAAIRFAGVLADGRIYAGWSWRARGSGASGSLFLIARAVFSKANLYNAVGVASFLLLTTEKGHLPGYSPDLRNELMPTRWRHREETISKRHQQQLCKSRLS